MLARSLFPVLMRVCRGLSVCVSYFVQLKGEVGTPMWMAPEVLMNESFTFKADVYSFGVVCWELLTGKVPWKGMLPAQIICGVAFNGMRLSIPEEIDGRLASLMCDCWHEEPAQRPSFDEDEYGSPGHAFWGDCRQKVHVRHGQQQHRQQHRW